MSFMASLSSWMHWQLNISDRDGVSKLLASSYNTQLNEAHWEADCFVLKKIFALFLWELWQRWKILILNGYWMFISLATLWCERERDVIKINIYFESMINWVGSLKYNKTINLDYNLIENEVIIWFVHQHFFCHMQQRVACF